MYSHSLDIVLLLLPSKFVQKRDIVFDHDELNVYVIYKYIVQPIAWWNVYC